jgi:hypothetical protein
MFAENIIQAGLEQVKTTRGSIGIYLFIFIFLFH